MSYQTAVDQLYHLGHELAQMPSHKFDLAHMRVLLEALGDPQHKFRSVLIAGTNGKGSTAATLASILHAAGHKTGLYTSPHLITINERIRIGGRQISETDFAAAHERVEAVAAQLVSAGSLPWHPSFFEMLTAMAFLYFAEQPVEIAVLEVGMGGRLDATNVVEPIVSVITDISLDHQKFLGNTIAEIAQEKAGIIHPGGLLVTLPQHPQANDVIGKAVMERNATAVSAVQYMPPVSPGTEGTAWETHAGATQSLSADCHGQGDHGGFAACRPASVAQHRTGDRGGRAIGSCWDWRLCRRYRARYPRNRMARPIPGDSGDGDFARDRDGRRA